LAFKVVETRARLLNLPSRRGGGGFFANVDAGGANLQHESSRQPIEAMAANEAKIPDEVAEPIMEAKIPDEVKSDDVADEVKRDAMADAEADEASERAALEAQAVEDAAAAEVRAQEAEDYALAVKLAETSRPRSPPPWQFSAHVGRA
jgi:hypothetical protein